MNNKSIVIRCLLVLAILLSMSGNIAFAERQGQTALKSIQAMGLGNNLKQMGLMTAMNTQTYKMVVHKEGEEKAQQMLIKQLELTVPAYQSRWDQNLADSYLDYFTEEELASLSQDKEKSPYVQKFMSHRNAVGADMESRSTKLLTDMVAEVIVAVFKQAYPN